MIGTALVIAGLLPALSAAVGPAAAAPGAPASPAAAPRAVPSGGTDDRAELALPDLDGRLQDLRGLRGRIVVLNFWATWCVPCRAEMPVLAGLQERYGGRGVEVVGASADGPGREHAVRAMSRDLGVNFPILVGATTGDMRRLGLGEALPATAIVDRDGRIAARIVGPAESSDLEERIDWLLGDRAGPAPETLLDTFTRHPHDHEAGEDGHAHGGVGLEGASLVPS